jgi:hypothetical protein
MQNENDVDENMKEQHDTMMYINGEKKTLTFQRKA